MKDELKKAMAVATEAGGPPAELTSQLSDAGAVVKYGDGKDGTHETNASIDGGQAPLHLFASLANNQSSADGPQESLHWLDGGPCPSDILMARADLELEDKDDDDTDDAS